MGDDSGGGIIFGLGLIAGALLMMAIMFACLESSENYWQRQAVERGAAHWETASDGSTTFKWNEPAQREKGE